LGTLTRTSIGMAHSKVVGSTGQCNDLFVWHYTTFIFPSVLKSQVTHNGKLMKPPTESSDEMLH